jgi:hypothetical protein
VSGAAPRRAAAALTYLAALALGGGLAVALIPPDVLLARGPYTAAIFGDAAQHVIGQRYFIADSWRWPLLRVKALGAPDGVSIAFTDSIPLAALPARLIGQAFPGLLPGGHAVLLWLALCFVLQPAAAVFAMRSAGVRRPLPCLAAAVICASMPALLARTGHAALCGHFLILLAIGLYLRIGRGSPGAAWLAAPLLLAATLLVHPYLLVMVAAMLAAAPLSLLLRGDRRWPAASAALALGIGVTAALAVALGYAQGQAYSIAFGHYSMNLASPFYPERSSLLPWFGTAPDATGGQYEGYNWLGVGGWVLVLAGVGSLGRRAALRLARRHAGLLLAGAVLTLLALSNEVWLGQRLLLRVRDVPALLQQFQASGRFFWPVGYLVVLGSAIAVAGWSHRRAAATLLVAAAALQFADTASLRQEVRERMGWPQPWAFDPDRMRALLAGHARLTLLAPFGCGKEFAAKRTLLQTLLLASEHPLPVNTMYVSRWREPPDCGGVALRPPAQGELQVYLPPEQSASLTLPDGGAGCRQLGAVAVCSADARLLHDLPPLAVPPVPAGQVVATRAGADLASLAWGWGPPTADFVPSEGARAVLVGRLAPPPAASVDVALWLRAGDAPEGVTVTATLGGQPLGAWTLARAAATEVHAEVPPGVDWSGPFVLRLAAARANGAPLDPATARAAFSLAGFRFGPAQSSASSDPTSPSSTGAAGTR